MWYIIFYAHLSENFFCIFTYILLIAVGLGMPLRQYLTEYGFDLVRGSLGVWLAYVL